MDAITALHRTEPIVAKLISGLSADQRELPTPCAGWTVHDLLAHMCLAADKATRALEQREPVGGEPTDYLADGPASGWATAATALDAAATPDALAGLRQFPFSPDPTEVPGEVLLSAVTVDHLVHAWDLATATDQPFDADDELVGWALALVQASVPVEGRTGHPFGPAVAVAEDATLTEQLVAYTGRQP